MRSWLIALFAAVCLPASCIGQQITGSVHDKAGRPEARVEVWGDALNPEIDPAHPYVHATTDAAGRFSILNPGSTLRLGDRRFRPSRVVVTAETHDIIFVLEPVDSDAVKVPFCEDSRFIDPATRKRNAGQLWQFLLPSHARVKQSTDTDYAVESIYFDKGEEHLAFAHGPIYGGYEAPAKWLVDAQEFTERAILAPDGEAAGVDVYGTLKTGQRFRSFGLGSDQITYQTGNPEAVEFFDAFIATACLPRYGAE